METLLSEAKELEANILGGLQQSAGRHSEADQMQDTAVFCNPFL